MRVIEVDGNRLSLSMKPLGHEPVLLRGTGADHGEFLGETRKHPNCDLLDFRTFGLLFLCDFFLDLQMILSWMSSLVNPPGIKKLADHLQTWDSLRV